MESKKHLRKLLHLYQSCVGDRELITNVQNATSSLSSSTPPSPSPSESRPPPWSLNSSMALTIFVLLLALFFMAFFSAFIRHFAEDDPTTEISSSRPIRRRSSSSTMSPRRHFSLRRGLDSQAVQSLPVYRYTEAAKHRIEDCVICLSDFEEGETVKVIPHCGHVFHVGCVDTWLSSHVTCPFCRSSQVLPDQDSAESSRRSTAEDEDTSAGMGPCARRCSSCSRLGHRTGLERSMSL